MKIPPRALRLWVCLSVLATTFLFTQACGQFNGSSDENMLSASFGSSGPSGANSSAGSIVSSSTTGQVGQNLTFTSTGLTLLPTTIEAWSNSLVDPSSGATLSPCTEIADDSSPTYQIVCETPGILTVQLLLADGSVISSPGNYEMSIVAAGGTTATPVPTPVPSPTPAVTGASLYADNCSSCHGSLGQSTINGRTTSSITSAISTIGAMKPLSILTPDEVLLISNALNGM